VFQDDESSTEMTDRILTMLSEFLQSNQNLRLNETFKIYLKVLSVEHMSQLPKTPKKIRKFKGKIHVGGPTDESITYNPKWAFNILAEKLTEPQKNLIKNKCLLIAFLLAYFQNMFFQVMDSKFSLLSQLNSKFKNKRAAAFTLLEQELQTLFTVTKLQSIGPYHLQSTVKILSTKYKCQIYIFNSLSNSKTLFFKYPVDFDDTLIPIFLFKTLENHIIFMKNLNYFLGRNLNFCFACSKFFKVQYMQHMCKAKPVCFTCRKIVQSPSTFIHKLLEKYYCDRNLGPQIDLHCSRCNLQIFTERCKINHSHLCFGKNTFGFLCQSCYKFVASKNPTQAKTQHICHEQPICHYCFERKQTDHLCKLKKEKVSKQHPRLAFFTMEFYEKSILDNKNPCLAVILRESESRECFKKYLISDSFFNCDTTLPIHEIFPYLPNFIKKMPFENKLIKPDSLCNAQLSMLEKNANAQNDCLLKFLKFVLDKMFTNTTYICQDRDSVILMTLLKGFLQYGFCPEVVKKSKNIMLLEIPELGLRFLNSNNYLDGHEYQISEQFGITFEEIFFPQTFLLESNVEYSGLIPDVENFVSIFDDSDRVFKKSCFVQNFHNEWNLKKQLLFHSEQRLLLLTQSMLYFIKESYDMQFLIKKFKGISNQDIVMNVMAKPICSLSGFVFRVFKLFFLNDYDLYAVNFEYGYPSRQVSQLEYEYVSYMEYCLKDKKCISGFNNPNGQKNLKFCIPDLYCESDEEIFFLNGCFIHADMRPDCPINRGKTAQSLHPFGGTYGERNQSFFSKLENCMNEYPNLKKCSVMWECTFKDMKKTPEFKLFQDNFFKFHPLVRLSARSTVRACFSQVYALKWQKKKFSNEKFYCLDINGLYSMACTSFPFMIGKYEILIGEKVNNVKLNNNQFSFEGSQISGAMLITYLAPKNLLFPFLMYRKKNGSNVLGLCCECCEIERTLDECYHADKYRQFTGSYMISEIEFALQLGYELIAIHEVHCFKNNDYILKPFVEFINYHKLLSTDCFKNCKTDLEKANLCKFMNSSLSDYQEKITPSTIQPNVMKKNFFKFMCNSLFGRFLTRKDKPSIRYVHSQEELQNLYNSSSRIEDFHCLNDNTCLVNVTVNSMKLPPNRDTNVYIGSQIIAYSREIMYRHLMKLQEIPKCKIYQIECDSLFFSLPADVECPLRVSPILGDFKHVYDSEIISFYSIGQKQYCLNLYKEDSKVESVFKVSGLSLGNQYNQALLSEDTFEEFLDKYCTGENISKQFRNKKFKSDFYNLKVISFQQKYTLTNRLSHSRFVNSFDERFSTYPFGFCFE